MSEEQDKPEGTEQHAAGSDPERQGPGEEAPQDESPETQPPATGEPRGDEAPARPGVTSPKRA